jgi:hypothetical protein
MTSAMQPIVALLLTSFALAAPTLCACTPAPPPEPMPPSGVPRPPTAAPAEPPAAAAPEPKVEEDTRCKCPAEASAAAEATADAAEPVDDEGPDAQARAARARRELPKALAAQLRAELPDHRAACDVALSGPCTVRGDIDGDGALDDVVLVRSRAGAGGIAILWGKGGVDLLGGGRRGQCWTRTEVPDLGDGPGATPCPEEIDADLGWLARWELRPRRLRNDVPILVGRLGARTLETQAPGAMGDGLQLDGGDAVAVLYRTESGWTLMHLGF